MALTTTFRAEGGDFLKYTNEVLQIDRFRFYGVGAQVHYYIEQKENVLQEGTSYEEVWAEGFVSEAPDDGDITVKWLAAVKRVATMDIGNYNVHADTASLSEMRALMRLEGGFFEVADPSKVSNVFDLSRFEKTQFPFMSVCLEQQLEKLPTTVVTLSACRLTEEGRIKSTLVSMSGEETVITCPATAGTQWLISEYRQANPGHGLTKIKIVDSAAHVIEDDIHLEGLIQ